MAWVNANGLHPQVNVSVEGLILPANGCRQAPIAACSTGRWLRARCPLFPPPLASALSGTAPDVPVPHLCLPRSPSAASLPASRPRAVSSLPSLWCLPSHAAAQWFTANAGATAPASVTPCAAPGPRWDPSAWPSWVFIPVRWVKTCGLFCPTTFI